MKVWKISIVHWMCVYSITSAAVVVESCYGRLKEDVLRLTEKGQVVLLSDFNACVGRSVEVDLYVWGGHMQCSWVFDFLLE